MANKETTLPSETPVDDADECYVDMSVTVTRDPEEEKWVAMFDAIDREKAESMRHIEEQIKSDTKSLKKVYAYRILFSVMTAVGLLIFVAALSMIYYEKSSNLAKFSGCNCKWTHFKQPSESASNGKLRYKRSRCSSRDYAPAECPLECDGSSDSSMESAEEILCRKYSFGELSPSLVHMKNWKKDFSLLKLVNLPRILESQSEIGRSEAAC